MCTHDLFRKRFLAEQPAPPERNLIWMAAGGKAEDTPTQEQVIAAVKALRDLADKFAEVMVKNMSPSELRELLDTCRQ